MEGCGKELGYNDVATGEMRICGDEVLFVESGDGEK